MKYNTYDMPAIKYYCTLGNQTEENDKPGYLNNVFSFDDIDGLTIEELKDLIEIMKKDDKSVIYYYAKINYITIFLGVTFTFRKKDNNYTYTSNTPKLHLDIIIPLNSYGNDERIDEIVEKELLKYASENHLCEYNLKLIKCFLQRYRYNTMDEVDEVLSTKKPLKRVYTPK